MKFAELQAALADAKKAGRMPYGVSVRQPLAAGRLCASCGHSPLAGANFCGSCGQSLAAVAAPVAAKVATKAPAKQVAKQVAQIRCDDCDVWTTKRTWNTRRCPACSKAASAAFAAKRQAWKEAHA